jgi:hypothetical protein
MKWLAFVIALPPLVVSAADKPSRPADKGCAWQKLSDASLGLEAWVERCDYGFRKIDFVAQGHSLAQRYSDGGALEPVVDVIDRLPSESGEAAAKRVFAMHTDKRVAARCVPAPYKGMKARKDVQRLTFVPNAAYAKELRKNPPPAGDMPEPPCGEWGESPDGIQYFEIHPSSQKILFVRVGQDIPLFDEQTLRMLK